MPPTAVGFTHEAIAFFSEFFILLWLNNLTSVSFLPFESISICPGL